MSRRSVCLVTDEFHPATPGGIGRLLYNLVQDSGVRGAPVDFHLLVPAHLRVSDAELQSDLGRQLGVHRVRFRRGSNPLFVGEQMFPPPDAFTDTACHAQSLDILLALRELAGQGLVFDVVEFPDFRGWAFCALQEKRLGRSFEGTLLTVRLHGAEAVLHHFEPRHPDQALIGIQELERRSLEEADLVVAHLPPVAAFYRSFFGFDEAWGKRVRVEFPPVARTQLGPIHRPPPKNSDLIFPTKVQVVKRPDLFVRAAATFLLRNPEFTGRAVLLARESAKGERERLERIIPRAVRSRFDFEKQAGTDERERRLANSITVVSSDYESLNLASYEAAAAGATMVLNGACVAFGSGSPWRDGENCHLFDGTVEGAARALERAWRAPHPDRVQWKVDPPYWEEDRGVEPVTLAVRAAPLVSVVMTNHNLGAFLPAAMASVAASDHREIEVVLVDDASTDPRDAAVLDALERAPPVPRLRVLRQPVNLGLPAARNVGIAAARGEYILPLDADDCISTTFISLAASALERHPEYSAVVPTVARFRTDEELARRRFSGFICFIGNVPSLGLVANRLGGATVLLRRQLVASLRYDERLTSYEDWDLYLRLAQRGHRFLVTSDVHCFYRQRPGSMISGVDRGRHFLLISRLLENLPLPLHPGTRLFGLIVPAAEVETDGVGGRPMRYRMADGINSALKRVPGLHRALKAIIRRRPDSE